MGALLTYNSGSRSKGMDITMKKYNITVNGTVYEVEVEEAGTDAASASSTGTFAAAAPTSSPVPASDPAPSAPAAAASSAAPQAGASAAAGAEGVVTAPMPGTVLDIKVSPGQAVNKGDVLIILEAMKMENEIMAPAAGTVDTIPASKGASVNAGAVLVTLK